MPFRGFFSLPAGIANARIDWAYFRILDNTNLGSLLSVLLVTLTRLFPYGDELFGAVTDT